MGKTIRDFIKERVRAVSVVAFLGWLLFVVAGATSRRHPSPLIFFGFLLFGGAVLCLNLLVRCPRCSRRLAQSIAMPVAFYGKSAPNFCPYCGVSLDEPLQPSETSADNVTTPDKLIWK